MSLLSSVKHILKMCGHALNITVHEQLSAAEVERQANATNVEFKIGKLMETDAGLLQASIHIIENLHALAGQTIVRTEVNASGSSTAPEIALLEYLYSYVPCRAAVLVDSASCDIAPVLARAGYDVYCAEARGREIPEAVGLIALGGNPLPAIRELGDRKASVIAVDLAAPVEELVPEMRARQYHWNLVVYRVRNGTETGPGDALSSYFANHADIPADANGSVFFFRDYKVFAEAQAWCAAILPRTYFKSHE
jgi:hypothetical protein